MAIQKKRDERCAYALALDTKYILILCVDPQPMYKPISYSLNDFVRKRTGRSLGASGSLRAMLKRSFGAASPRIFWQYWNPVFGYYLGKYVYQPSRSIFPPLLSLFITFAVSGLIHDAVTFAVRGFTNFFFLIFFLTSALILILSEYLNIHWSKYSLPVRVLFNLAHISGSFVFSYRLAGIL